MTALKRITLRLARNPDAGFPDGDHHRGYTIVAPLHADGRLDVEAWRAARRTCTVIRFSPDADERADEPFFRLIEHKFVAGEHVSVTDPDGPMLVYRIAEVVATNA